MDRVINDLRKTLYATPLSPELWSSTLTGLTELLHLNASAIVRSDLTCKANGVYISKGLDPEVERLYALGYGNQDVYRPRFLKMRGRQGDLLMVVTATGYLSPRFCEGNKYPVAGSPAKRLRGLPCAWNGSPRFPGLRGARSYSAAVRNGESESAITASCTRETTQPKQWM